VNLFLGLITSSIVGSLVLILLLALKPITNRVFSKTWHYYSLLVALIFLLGGTHIPVGWADLIPNIGTEANSASINVHPFSELSEVVPIPMGVLLEPITLSPLDGFMEIAPTDYSRGAAIDIVSSLSIVRQIIEYLEMITPILAPLWALGAILFIALSIEKYLKYRQAVLHGAKRADRPLCNIPIVISENAHTPMLIGVLKPIIVLPDMDFADEELCMILTHEMIHYRRKDLIIKLLTLIANALHWFNPAAYALNNQLNLACELSCDEKVVSEMGTKDRVVYGETILKVLQHSTTYNSPIGNVAFATNLCNSKKSFKRRLISMMNTKKMKKSVVALALATGVLITGGGFAISNLVDAAMPAVSATEAEQNQYNAEIGDFINDVPGSDVISGEAAAQVAADVLDADTISSNTNHYSADEVVLQSMLMWPVESYTRITSPFGMMTNPLSGREEFHTGIDIPAPEGTLVLAAKDGYVTILHDLFNDHAQPNILLTHGDNGRYTTLYMHLSAIHVEEGQFVRRGEHIGDVGSFGTGPHLHFEFRIYDRAVDPLSFLGLEIEGRAALDSSNDRSIHLTLRDLEMQREVYDWTESSSSNDLNSTLYVIEHTERGISFELAHISFENPTQPQLPEVGLAVSFENAAKIAADAIYEAFGICIDSLSGHMLFVDNEYMQIQFWSGFIRCEESTAHSDADELFHFVIDAVTGEVRSLYMNTEETPFRG